MSQSIPAGQCAAELDRWADQAGLGPGEVLHAIFAASPPRTGPSADVAEWCARRVFPGLPTRVQRSTAFALALAYWMEGHSVERIVAVVGAAYDRAGLRAPAWLATLETPTAAQPLPETARGMVTCEDRAAAEAEGWLCFYADQRDVVRTELEAAGLAPADAERHVGEVFDRFATGTAPGMPTTAREALCALARRLASGRTAGR